MYLMYFFVSNGPQRAVQERRQRKTILFNLRPTGEDAGVPSQRPKHLGGLSSGPGINVSDNTSKITVEEDHIARGCDDLLGYSAQFNKLAAPYGAFKEIVKKGFEKEKRPVVFIE